MPTTNYIWDEQSYLAETDQNNVVQTVYTTEPQQYAWRRFFPVLGIEETSRAGASKSRVFQNGQ
jgi:hypothetical protein